MIRLLSQVSDTQLSNAFPSHDVTGRDGGLNYIPLARIDRRGIDEWSQFPLDNAQNIRDWQHVLTGQGTEDSGTSSPDKADQSPVHYHQGGGVKRKRLEQNENSFRDPSFDEGSIPMISPSGAIPHHRHEQPLVSPVNTRPHLDQYWLSFESATKRAQMENKSQFSGMLNLPMEAPIQPDELPSVQRNSTWEGAPSVNFQQQFLW